MSNADSTRNYTIEEITDAGHDEDNAGRVRALCAHLDCSPDALSEGYNSKTFVLNRRKVKRGTSPEEARKLAAFVRETLGKLEFFEPHPESNAHNNLPGRTFMIAAEDWTRAEINRIGYHTIERVARAQQPEAVNRGIHDFVNALYFISDEANKYKTSTPHEETLCEAFDGGDITDRRTTEWTDSGEYMVLDDDEADRAWDDSLENYLDDCVEGADGPYFDREAWKRDARSDGRGHSLSSYDGCETEQEGKDTEGDIITYYIYRIN